MRTHLSVLVALPGLPALLLLGGCGDISNAWILADTEFLDALPTADHQTVGLDTTGGAAKGIADAPQLLQLSYAVSANVNGLIFQVLWAVDAVRAIRPTERTEDSRVWGPFAWRDGVELRAEMSRTGAGRFDWGIDALSDSVPDGVRYVSGTHYAGDTVADGDGQFTFVFDDLSAMLGETDAGTFTVDYDNRAGVDLLVDIDSVTDGSYAPVTARYAYRHADDEGDFQYDTLADTSGDGSLETIQVRTRWLDGQGGRSDAIVTGGSVGSAVVEFTQCWDDTLALTYQVDNYGIVTPTGSVDACPFADFARVDRL
jgi:hypothetical protein